MSRESRNKKIGHRPIQSVSEIRVFFLIAQMMTWQCEFTGKRLAVISNEAAAWRMVAKILGIHSPGIFKERSKLQFSFKIWGLKSFSGKFKIGK
jgi:hypothetical protein